MAPSLPGPPGRRVAARASSASSVTSMKREGSFKREARSSRTGMVAAPSKKQDTDSEDQGSSASGSKQSPRKTAPRARGRPRKQPIPPPEEEEDDDEGKDQEEDEEEGRDADEDESRDESKDEEDSAEGEESSEEQTPVSVVLEEIEGEIDEAGETKITKDGQLLGGRQYKCRSFKLPDRGDRIYMLSMDPARVLGFRDSYLFFLRNPQLVRVNTTMEERQWMIENGMLMANFKSKLIAVVTARSIFKSFGARIIKGGRSRVDDYYEANATGEDLLEDSEGDAASRAGDDQMTFGASGGTGVNGAGRSARESSNAPSSFKRRNMQQDEYVRQVTDLNWQYESAMAVRALNARLTELRKESPRFLDPHTNVEQIPILLQPSRCDVVPAAASSDMNASQLPLTLVAGSEPQPSSSSSATAVVSTPRSIGPQVDAAVKINIRPGAPPPPFIHDPEVWAAIPEDIRRALDDAELIARSTEYEDEGDVTRYPISILSGQYQESYPIHQSRFQQPYRIVLPQSMTPHAHYIHHLWTTQVIAEKAAAAGVIGGVGRPSRDQSPAPHRSQHGPPMPPHQPIHHQPPHPQLNQQVHMQKGVPSYSSSMHYPPQQQMPQQHNRRR